MFTLSRIRELCSSVGIDDCAVTVPHLLDDDARYLIQWLQKGYNGSMTYMEQNLDKRTDPQKLYPYCKSILVCLLSYYKKDRQVKGAPYISISGLSRNDYHIVMKNRLNQLEQMIISECGEQISSAWLEPQHVFCDSAPVFERRLACEAGLGIIGKNHLFIHPILGSYVHIGILMLPIDIYDDRSSKLVNFNPCAGCRKCINNCPTGALRDDLFDARKCVSYLTIERKEPLDAKYNNLLENRLYGCDNCQLVCPCNQSLKETSCDDLKANAELLAMTKDDWNNSSHRKKLKLLHRLAKKN